MMSENIRIKTTPGGGDKKINVKIEQDFDFIEVLSLKITQEDAYKRYCSDYGVAVGRVIVNNGLGVPNAKVSIFIPITEVDSDDSEILGLYPYEVISDKDDEGIPYNLLTNSPRGKDECYTTVGTFPTKREILDNPEVNYIYKKYYKFTTNTNESGDFMIFGLPVGNHYLHVDADISDIGIISQKPYDLINQGVDKKNFYSSSKFKGRDEDPNLTQIKTVGPISVNVVPFWGDTEQCEIGISRVDVDLKTTVIPTAIFMGSIFSDSDKNSVNKNCRPRRNLGKSDELIAGPGTIEMIRYNNEGGIENFDIEGGRLIDDNGTWAYQIPMNLDYVITAEDGTLIRSEDKTKGIATKAKVRFRVGMDENGGEERLRTRAKYLIPHNPKDKENVDYSFGPNTKESFFKDMYWNKIYTVKNKITRVQSTPNVERRTFIGIKDVDEGNVNNPFPFNKLDTKGNPLFIVICIILSIIVSLICLFNSVIIKILNFIFTLINAILSVLCTVVFSIAKTLTTIIPPRIGPIKIWKNSKKAAFRRSACAGCCKDGSKCKDCDCTNIIGLVPYITLPCEEQFYAPCGDGKGWLGSATLKATQSRIDQNEAEEPSSDEDSSACSKEPFNEPENLNYVGDGRCHEDTKIFGLLNINDAGFLSCVLLQIGQALNVFKFDFYNDWLNGSLYSFLLKYKSKNNGDKYCKNDNGYSNYIVDSCTNTYQKEGNTKNDLTLSGGVDSSKNVKINEGYIKKYDGELYYAAYSRTKSYKLFATDIVSLGSIFDCDWQGVPKIYPYLVDTTYNMPPLVGEFRDDNKLDVSGYDSSDCESRKGGTTTPLIGTITCLGLMTGSRQCDNIRRLSELGMGLDEYRNDETPPGGPTDNKITNEDVDNSFVRGSFIYANKWPNVDTNGIVLTEIDGDMDFDYEDITYKDFINPSSEKTIWEYDNSFYFYFGLKPGKTALNRLMNEFLVTCDRELDNDFFITVTNIFQMTFHQHRLVKSI